MRFAAFILAVPALFAQGVTFDRIVNSRKEPQNWLTYSGTYDGQRYSLLDKVNTANVKKLHMAWVYQTGTLETFETTPIVADGVMYITVGPNQVAAIDTRTGALIWKYTKEIPDDLRLCCGKVNRGVAILGDMVYYTSIDAHIIGIDAKTGRMRWDTVMGDYKLGYSATAAPLAVKDKIVTGMAGGEFGVQGFVDAYDAKTGKRVWRFNTVAQPGQFGHDSWAGDSWIHGSATTWVTGSYDVESNTVVWGTGNPGPDWNGDVRMGDNLFSDSFVALDADTGTRKWHFQFTPHDDHDWDSVQVPVFADTTFRGEKRKLVITANRNGFFYVLDRMTGKFLHGKPFIKQTWAKGLDDNGRPILAEGSHPTEQGAKLWPSLGGGTNWFSPSYSPKTNLFYAPSREQGAIYYKGEAEWKIGQEFNGGGEQSIPGEEPYGAVRAIDPESGSTKWEFRMHRPASAGILTTAGNLLFSGTTSGELFALNSTTGELLWRFSTTGHVGSCPITYALDGKQYVAFASGHALFIFTLGE